MYIENPDIHYELSSIFHKAFLYVSRQKCFDSLLFLIKVRSCFPLSLLSQEEMKKERKFLPFKVDGSRLLSECVLIGLSILGYQV